MKSYLDFGGGRLKIRHFQLFAVERNDLSTYYAKIYIFHYTFYYLTEKKIRDKSIRQFSKLISIGLSNSKNSRLNTRLKKKKTLKKLSPRI